MSVRHYLTITEKDEIVFETQILGNNDFFNDDFKYYRNMEDGILYDCEIDIKYLFNYWRKWLDNHDKLVNMKIADSLKNDEDKLFLDTFLGHYYILEPFLVLNALKDYFDIDLNLKKECKAYLEIC